MNILQNNALNLYDRILEVLLDKNIVKIQQFANDFVEQEKFDLMCIFFETILMDILNYNNTKNNNTFIEKRKNIFDLIKKRNEINKFLQYYDYFHNTINDINIYNLDKKQAINVIINNIKL